jgi:hypothetical protein
MFSPAPADPGSSSPFGGYAVRIDPWAVEYGGETPAELSAEGPEAADAPELELAIERAVADWGPVAPPALDRAVPLRFLDGVRRIEARLVVSREGRTVHGALGTYGVGVVACGEGRASFVEERFGRVILFGSGERPPAPVVLDPSLVYAPRSVAEADPDAPLRGLHAEMRAVEGQVARAHAAEASRVVIADGPLHPGEPTAGHIVGFVKRLFELYLPPDLLPVLRGLPIATRTPVFRIVSRGLFSRYSWFLRLGPRLPIESEYTGLVRLEVADRVGREAAIGLADLTGAALPRYVPPRSRDPRAPQNLVPIGALEHHLRRGLGDARLIHRRLATRLARELRHV